MNILLFTVRYPVSFDASGVLPEDRTDRFNVVPGCYGMRVPVTDGLGEASAAPRTLAYDGAGICSVPCGGRLTHPAHHRRQRATLSDEPDVTRLQRARLKNKPPNERKWCAPAAKKNFRMFPPRRLVTPACCSSSCRSTSMPTYQAADRPCIIY